MLANVNHILLAKQKNEYHLRDRYQAILIRTKFSTPEWRRLDPDTSAHIINLVK